MHTLACLLLLYVLVCNCVLSLSLTLRFPVFECRKVSSNSWLLFQATLWGAQQWKASELLVIDEEPLICQPWLCYANSSALYAETDPLLPSLNKIDFILSFYGAPSCLRRAVIWWCFMVQVCLCVPEGTQGCLTSEFLSCVKRITFFGAEFNEMINDPQDSHSQQGEKRNEGAEDWMGFLQLYVSCGSPLKTVNCFWKMKSFFLIVEAWFSFDVCRSRQKRVLESFFKWVSVLDQRWVNEKVIRQPGFLCILLECMGRMKGSFLCQQMSCDVLALYSACKTICSDWFQLIVLTFPCAPLWTAKGKEGVAVVALKQYWQIGLCPLFELQSTKLDVRICSFKIQTSLISTNNMSPLLHIVVWNDYVMWCCLHWFLHTKLHGNSFAFFRQK